MLRVSRNGSGGTSEYMGRRGGSLITFPFSQAILLATLIGSLVTCSATSASSRSSSTLSIDGFARRNDGSGSHGDEEQRFSDDKARGLLDGRTMRDTRLEKTPIDDASTTRVERRDTSHALPSRSAMSTHGGGITRGTLRDLEITFGIDEMVDRLQADIDELSGLVASVDGDAGAKCTLGEGSECAAEDDKDAEAGDLDEDGDVNDDVDSKDGKNREPIEVDPDDFNGDLKRKGLKGLRSKSKKPE